MEFDLQSMAWPDAFLRVSLAIAFGFFLGYDRNKKRKPIDFRVFMIVAMASCLLAMMGLELYAVFGQSEGILGLDLLRIVQGVLIGIGFLGTGAIIKVDEKQKVYGTATGASIWCAGAIGLLLGFGFYGLAFLGFLSLFLILVIFGLLRWPLFHEHEEEV